MKFRKTAAVLLSVLLAVQAAPLSLQASFEQNVEAFYNTAVQGQGALDGLDVTVAETTVSSSTNLSSEKKVDLKVTGMKGNSLQADIRVDTQEGTTESYYRNGYYYTNTSDGKQKQEMDRSTVWDLINSEVYMNMTSNYLKLLYSQTSADGGTIFHFAANSSTLGDYTQKFLQGSGEGQGVEVDFLQGTLETDPEGNIVSRNTEIVYTVTNGENAETFMVEMTADFHQNSQTVSLSSPDLAEYKESKPEKPSATITTLVRTVYTTEDVNVRASGSISAVILGGLNAGSGVTQTGYTSDGWIQIQYNGSTGYIWGDYISTVKPVLTKVTNGTMYATCGVNVRSGYSSDNTIIGSLSKGQGIDITGITDNNWIRVKYNGHTGYVYADYLSWSEPVADTYVQNGYLSGVVTDASFGSLTIQRDDGRGTASFNTTYASLNLKDTIYTGDWVEVYFTGVGTPYAASQVNDYTSHTDAGDAQSVTIEGVVVTCKPDQIEVMGSDGIYRTFDIEDSDLEMADDLCEGMVVTVSWMSKTNGAETKNIKALRVKA